MLLNSFAKKTSDSLNRTVNRKSISIADIIQPTKRKKLSNNVRGCRITMRLIGLNIVSDCINALGLNVSCTSFTTQLGHPADYVTCI